MHPSRSERIRMSQNTSDNFENVAKTFKKLAKNFAIFFTKYFSQRSIVNVVVFRLLNLLVGIMVIQVDDCR